MGIKWSDFTDDSPILATDIIVGLRAGANVYFSVSGLLVAASNLADVAAQTTAFNNLSPVTTTGDMIYRDATNNIRLAIGNASDILSVVGGVPAWVANPGLLIANDLSDLNDLPTALANLGLSSADDVAFNSVQVGAENAITAFAGGGQGSATALTKQFSRVTVVATAGDSVKLPAAIAGNSMFVKNAAAVNAMDLFPAAGESINALVADTALSVAADSAVMCNCVVDGIWDTIVTA